MNKISGKYFIIEDNFYQNKLIDNIMRDFDKTTTLADYSDGTSGKNFKELYNNLNTLKITNESIFIIDIDLRSYFTGIDFAQKIREINQNCFIIFLTAVQFKGVEIINRSINASGYILKDISFEETTHQLHSLLTNIVKQIYSEKNDMQRVLVNYNHQALLLNPNEIFYISSIKGHKNKIFVKLTNEEIMCDGTLTSLKEQLSTTYFCKSLKSYIINVLAITGFSRVDGVVYFTDNSELYIGKTAIDKLKKEFFIRR